jgi:hypothetical protein
MKRLHRQAPSQAAHQVLLHFPTEARPAQKLIALKLKSAGNSSTAASSVLEKFARSRGQQPKSTDNAQSMDIVRPEGLGTWI